MWYIYIPFVLQLLKSNPERVYTCEREGLWWRRGLEGEARTELRVMADKGRGLWSQLTTSEKSKLYDAIGYLEDIPSRPEKPKQYTGSVMLFFIIIVLKELGILYVSPSHQVFGSTVIGILK